ncbi:MAG: Asp-tRNA(Asn)/Glu-tRNA(Gln) amidotransferase subunit GatB [Clostridia bacterium]|nr:Asp-tRNA(Asn)/Glu-tRNA(Gln) amidotransferase subunit GatB [Clostridia bacterium]
MNKKYEMIVGLEVHVELSTDTKIFCSCSTRFGAAPNTQCCPVCMGLPGSMPVLNRRVVEYAIKAGLATNCKVSRYSGQDRKNYFYPDLPKAYQISQYASPLCRDGYVEIKTESGKRRIGIERIHIEEDAGKLIHDERGTLIDFNRCGVPLIEIVSHPDIRSAEEAKEYLRTLRTLMLYAGVSDCRMNEGSLRCDVNISLRKRGSEGFGVRCEIKNINSFSFVAKAIEYEFARQADMLERGEEILQETRRFDMSSGRTYPMRSKESADDYRYFPDPDLPRVEVSDEMISDLLLEMPRLPAQRREEYISRYGIGEYESELLTSDKALADYFEAAAEQTEYRKTLANIIISELLRLARAEDFECGISPKSLAELATLAGSARINSSTAKKLLQRLWEKDFSPFEIVVAEGLEQINDEELLRRYVTEAIEASPASVQDYKRGKTAAAKAIVGRVMSATGGRANPAIASRLTEDMLDSI